MFVAITPLPPPAYTPRTVQIKADEPLLPPSHYYLRWFRPLPPAPSPETGTLKLSFFTRNQGLSRFVRFNIQQALLLDIVLIIPSFFGDIGRVFPAELQAMGTNFVFYLMVLVVGYSWFNVAQGKTPNAVPIISEAADMQNGPF